MRNTAMKKCRLHCAFSKACKWLVVQMVVNVCKLFFQLRRMVNCSCMGNLSEHENAQPKTMLLPDACLPSRPGFKPFVPIASS